MEYSNQILTGDALTVLKELPSNFVQCCITSPPYYGLRDYGTEPLVWDGDPTCSHEWDEVVIPDRHGDDGMGNSSTLKGGLTTQAQTRIDRYSGFCRRCNAWHGSLGLEPTPDLYVQHLVQIFREVRRTLRPDGTLWLNIGDSYAGNFTYGNFNEGFNERWGNSAGQHKQEESKKGIKRSLPNGYKSKDLMMIPARVALALQTDGWWLRSDIIWHKLTAMPESVTDRPTSAHEHIFLLAKSERYFYDADAIREPLRPKTFTTFGIKHQPQGNDALGLVKSDNWGRTVDERQPRLTADGEVAGANKRNVWPLSSQPYPESHFATFPPKLIEPMVLAGTSPQACEQCGTPWERVIEPTGHINNREPAHAPFSSPTKVDSTGWAPTRRGTDQWQPTCRCKNDGQGHCLVLDPFMGAGTTALVALQQHRHYLGIELNPDYVQLAYDRISCVQPVLWMLDQGA